MQALQQCKERSTQNTLVISGTDLEEMFKLQWLMEVLIILIKKTWGTKEFILTNITAQLREEQVLVHLTKTPPLFTTKVMVPVEILTFYKIMEDTVWNTTVNSTETTFSKTL